MPRKSKTDKSAEWDKAGELAEKANAEPETESAETDGEELPQAEEGAKPVEHSAETDLPDGPSAEELSDHISKSGNKVFEEGEAREGIGQIRGKGTGAYIEIVVPRQPALEAAMRAEATARGLADGSIKPEDAPGAQLAEGERNQNDGGSPEFGNSRLESHDFNSDPIGDKRAADSAKAPAASQLTATKGSEADGSVTEVGPVAVGTEPVSAEASVDEDKAASDVTKATEPATKDKPSVEDLF